MSTYYDIHCRTCDAAAGFHINRGEEQLALLVNWLDAWARVGEALHAQLNLDFKLWGDEGGSLGGFPTFARAHAGHDVTVRDEYGGFVDKCCEWFNCPTCRHGARCALDRGHEGGHKP